MEEQLFVNLWGEVSDCCEAFSEFAFQMELEAELPLLPFMENYLEEPSELPSIPIAFEENLFPMECFEEEEEAPRRNVTFVDQTSVVY